MYKSLKTAFHDKFLLCGKAVWRIQTDLRISDIIPTSTKQILLHIWWLMWCTLGFMTQCSVAWLAESAPLSYGSCMDQGMWFLSFWLFEWGIPWRQPNPGQDLLVQAAGKALCEVHEGTRNILHCSWFGKSLQIVQWNKTHTLRWVTTQGFCGFLIF